MSLESFRQIARFVPASVKRRITNQTARIGLLRERAGRGYSARNDVISLNFPELSPGEVEEALRMSGIYLGLRLPGDKLHALLEYAENSVVYGNREPSQGFLLRNIEHAERVANKKFTLASYYNAVENCEALRDIVNDPVLNEIAMRYVGPRCKRVLTSMWWSFSGSHVGFKEQHTYAQMYHYDLDAQRFMKFFFYLTDVDKLSGPHVFIKGTHRRKKLLHLWPHRRLDDAEVEGAYDRDSILVLEGRAGDGFAEDTFGLHKGLTPIQRNRLILQIEFATSRVEYRDDFCDPKNLKRIDEL